MHGIMVSRAVLDIDRRDGRIVGGVRWSVEEKRGESERRTCALQRNISAPSFTSVMLVLFAFTTLSCFSANGIWLQLHV
jgi:hypothetical protein